MLYREQTFAPRALHSEQTQSTHRKARLEPAIRYAQKLAHDVFPLWRHVRTYARSITWQPNEKRLTISHEYGALSYARFARAEAPLIGNGVISLLWQLRSHCNPDHEKFSSLSHTTVVAIFPMFVYGDVAYAQTWQKNCIELLPYASTAYVVASNGPRFFSTVL